LTRHGLLGIRNGPEERRRHLRQLPRLPAEAAARVFVDGRRVPLPRRRRAAADRSHSGRAAQERRGVPRVERKTRRAGSYALTIARLKARAPSPSQLALLLPASSRCLLPANSARSDHVSELVAA